ncbi:hypothetical protein ADIAL_1589 [Alkalibacterium sp. AK22]|uniref:DUF6671 family protein n=1 Tax=Alkalibacterium sp. AK22 TaxID=1229520 RepID=UPI00044C9A36|nr:DUF6671 family protein [Alkalibacterium sp. AK22]EXJ22966.1 hypothetical protein ADIAL_1589 [Alkalibacterium sp. AK22]
MVKEKQNIFSGRTAVLGTMHKKERVIAPLFKHAFDIDVTVPSNFDSDQFGTFTREVKRRGDQLEAARYKAQSAMEISGQTLALSSEGTFGPHPAIPFFAVNRELILLLDQKNDLEISGMSVSTETNFKHGHVANFDEALAFALAAGFPEAGMVVRSAGQSEKTQKLFKGITDECSLQKAVQTVLDCSIDGTACIETDMRALYNPKRMKAIQAATHDLIKNMNSLCPACSCPGFMVTERIKGLPCGWCRQPTQQTLALTYACSRCGHNEDRYYPEGIEEADPGSCSFCNP